MKKILLIFILFFSLPLFLYADTDTLEGEELTSSATVEGCSGCDVIEGSTVTSGGGGITVTNLTADTCTAEDCDTAVEGSIDCNEISPTGMVYVTAGFADASSLGGGGVITVSGCGLTWNEMGSVTYGTRRHMSVWRGTGTWNSANQLEIVASDLTTFQEMPWELSEITGYNSGDPDDAAQTASGTGTTGSVPDVGTPDTGDVVFSAHCHEESEDNIALTGSITQLYKFDTGGNLRSMIIGYEGGTPDETPGFTTDTSGAFGQIGFIINVSP